MQAVFDRRGVTVGWIDDERVLDLRVQHRAFVRGSALFGYDTRYLGTFSGGFFRDRAGNAVAFIRGASGGPLLPLTQLPPIPPLAPLPPLKPLAPLAPLAPWPSLSWSKLSWEDFLSSQA